MCPWHAHLCEPYVQCHSGRNWTGNATTVHATEQAMPPQFTQLNRQCHHSARNFTHSATVHATARTAPQSRNCTNSGSQYTQLYAQLHCIHALRHSTHNCTQNSSVPKTACRSFSSLPRMQLTAFINIISKVGWDAPRKWKWSSTYKLKYEEHLSISA